MNDDAKKFFEELTNLDDDVETDIEVSADDEDYENDDLSPTGDREGQLAIDVYQTETSIVVESPVAGVNGEDLEININTDSVTINGRRERFKEVKEDDYFYQECYWGRFSRSVILPQEVNADKAEAKLKNGVLRIVMPKLQRSKGKKLKVKMD